MSVLEILPSCHKVCYFIKTKSRDQETANMVAESQSLQVIHKENKIGLALFFFFFSSPCFTMMYKKKKKKTTSKIFLSVAFVSHMRKSELEQV